MCYKFHLNAVEFFKSMSQQKTFAFGVEGRALHIGAVPS
jgi:hypothetical protein